MTKRRFSPGPIRTTVDNLPADWGYRSAEPLERNLGLDFTPLKEGGFLLHAHGKLFPPGKYWPVTLPISQTQLLGDVDDCRQVWARELVYHQPYATATDYKPFLKSWDQPVDAATLRRIGARLARAGDRLFFQIFRRHKDPKLQKIADRLEEVSRGEDLVMTVTSSEFFVPWSMLYVHPKTDEQLAADGMNFQWKGFWGYRHCIEHNPEDVELTHYVHPNGEGKIPTSVNIDESIDGKLRVDCIKPQLDFFLKQDGLVVTIRTDKASLEADFRTSPFPYHIVYFCCHGAAYREANQMMTQKPWIHLTDSELINAGDFEDWLRQRDLESKPLVFMNTCQGGQAHNMFYPSVASELLRKKAIGLIGAQIDVPATFAQRYAQSFFSLLLGDEQTNRNRVGQMLPDLARFFIDKHDNPLALGYSLYRGMDCTVNWETQPP